MINIQAWNCSCRARKTEFVILRKTPTSEVKENHTDAIVNGLDNMPAVLDFTSGAGVQGKGS